MKKAEVITFRQQTAAGELTSRIDVLVVEPSGADGMIFRLYGIDHHREVVVISQESGFEENSSGSQLQAISLEDARRLAIAVLELVEPCTPASEWGCEARRKLATARGALSEIAGLEPHEAEEGPALAWKAVNETAMQDLCSAPPDQCRKAPNEEYDMTGIVPDVGLCKPGV